MYTIYIYNRVSKCPMCVTPQVCILAAVCLYVMTCTQRLTYEGNEITPARFVASQVSTWTEVDKTLYNLDSKAKSTIGNAIIEPTFVKVSAWKTAKAIWDILITQYEGVTVGSRSRIVTSFPGYTNLRNQFIYQSTRTRSINALGTEFYQL